MNINVLLQQEAAQAYDRALVRRQGHGALTNYNIRNYAEDLERFEQGLGDDDRVNSGEKEDALTAAGNVAEE